METFLEQILVSWKNTETENAFSSCSDSFCSAVVVKFT